jgi:hypothetical protein
MGCGGERGGARSIEEGRCCECCGRAVAELEWGWDEQVGLGADGGEGDRL